ncbi:MAG: YfcE family phosphodiesterase [Candidatus Heimdallarchaeota archaeon]|nr:YfcE family phosphodiesterase [Candidatus Heimdallarchaeota archaeon]
MTKTIFIAGDLHIPSRATMLHPSFQVILESRKWDYIVLTGDYTIPSVVKHFELYLKNKENLIACRGNMDQFSLPDKPTFNINGINFGVYHGTDISPRGDIKQLKKIAKELGVLVLFTGHSHKSQLYYDEENIILNPGTSSGASGGSSWTVDTGIITITLLQNQLDIERFFISNFGKLKSDKIKIEL